MLNLQSSTFLSPILQMGGLARPMWTQGITLQVSELKQEGGLMYGTVPGLTAGQEYSFRVTAVNKRAPSQPSVQSESVITKEPGS